MNRFWISLDVHLNSSQLEEMLLESLARLEGGELSIGDFSQWFTNARWEAVVAANTSLLHLGWDIQNILAEWMAFPQLISPSEIARQMREAVGDNQLALPSLSVKSEAVSVGSGKSLADALTSATAETLSFDEEFSEITWRFGNLRQLFTRSPGFAQSTT